MIAGRPFLATLASAALFTGAAGADTPQAGALTGTWTGVLDVGPGLRLRLVIGADGSVALISLDQDSKSIPCKAVSLTPERVAFRAPPVGGRFEGRLVGTDRIEGQWTQRATLPLVFQRGEAPPAQTAASPLTQDMLRALRVEAGTPALVAASARRVQPAKLWVDGVRQAGAGAPAGIGDKWHLGSITKSFTATLTARLVEAGAVRWDDTVGAILGAATPQMREPFRNVTFRHLLSHRAGLQGNIPVGQFGKYAQTLADARAERLKWAQTALAMAPKGPAETTFEYSNNGYIIAGAMLEARTGQSWETLLARHVLEPLGLASAGFGAPGEPGRLDQPVGHSKKLLGDERKPFPPGADVTDNPAALGPAGRLHMSLADLLTNLAAHRDLTSPFLSTDSWRVLHTPPFGGEYAMGWIAKPDGSLWHNGSNTLWYAEAKVDRAAGIVAAAACNDGFLPKSSLAVSRALSSAAA